MKAMKTVAALCLAGMAAMANAQNTHTLPLVLAADTAGLEGFIRIVNRTTEINGGDLGFRAGTVQIRAIDDTGRRFGPVTLSIGAGSSTHFNSRDLEQGNASKGLPSGVGDGTGHWRLELSTALDISPLAYIRTADGFVTAMHDVVPSRTLGPIRFYNVEFFNPGSNRNQVSRLRLINLGTTTAEVFIGGRDDEGNPADVARVNLLPGHARMFTSQELETGGNGI